ncbi:lipocalin-like domain-containing protein [Sphingomonas zeicaulis]|uniref:lipocalin-like domain-containing protein n=1 Tax=Sphingomonas zeicaulis TaxID=1632740 RepID=UPI003D191061
MTGWLRTAADDPLGFQVTFLRTRPAADEGNPSRFAAKQLLFAHAALSDPRVGALPHGVGAARLAAWADIWRTPDSDRQGRSLCAGARLCADAAALAPGHGRL